MGPGSAYGYEDEPTLPGEGWAEYVPWLGAGWTILNEIGGALPPDFNSAPWQSLLNAGLGEWAQQARRLNCLGALGYPAQEIPSRMPGTQFETWDAQRIQDEILNPGAYGKIARGEVTQESQIAECLSAQARFGPLVSADDLRGGRRIVEYEDRYSTEPPVVITADDPTQAPDPTGPRSRTPDPKQADRYASAIRAILVLIQKIWESKRRKKDAPPGGPTFEVYPGVPGPSRPGPGPYPTGGKGPMAYINTSLLGGGDNNWGGVLNQALNTAASIWGPNQKLPGGGPVYTAGFQPAMFDMPGFDIVGQGMGSACSSLQSPFAASGGRGARAKVHVLADPVTGRPVWFRPAGRPILWSGDLSATKRVRKVAARAKRARGGR